MFPNPVGGVKGRGTRLRACVASSSGRLWQIEWGADWELSKPAMAREIEGYASRVSVAPGESLSFHVRTPSRWFDTRIYRLGWYGGAGARQITEIKGSQGGERATPSPRPGDGLVACDWPASFGLRVGTDWPSGVYLARFTAGDGGRQSYAPFIVREARAALTAGAGPRAPFL